MKKPEYVELYVNFYRNTRDGWSASGNDIRPYVGQDLAYVRKIRIAVPEELLPEEPREIQAPPLELVKKED